MLKLMIGAVLLTFAASSCSKKAPKRKKKNPAPAHTTQGPGQLNGGQNGATGANPLDGNATAPNQQNQSPNDGQTPPPGANIALEELALKVPASWSLAQDASVASRIFQGYSKKENSELYVRVYVVKDNGQTVESIFTSGDVEVTRQPWEKTANDLAWKLVQIQKDEVKSTGAFLKQNGKVYFLYARGRDNEQNLNAITEFVDSFWKKS